MANPTHFIKQMLFCIVLMGSALTAAATDNDDRTLSPYFVVLSDNPAVDQLPLKSTSADVSIAGVIADVTVTQVYKNDGKNTLEAIYVFPTSTRAAVYDMEMHIGNRIVKAKIKKRNEARAEYEAAKAEGRRVSLLEQDRPNVFKMNVANITSGDEVKVILKYTELLVPTEGTYEFVYPTVVGPRYSNQNASTAPTEDQFVNSPYTQAGELPAYNFDINVHLEGGMPLQSVHSTSHRVNTKFQQLTTADISLDASETKAGNRDYILQYKLQGEEIESGLLLYEGEEENFFLMMVQPPQKVTPKRIPPREFIFIVDVSGSMRGFALETTKKLLRDLVTNLQPGDKFNVLLFAGTSGLLSPNSLDANPENMNRALTFIQGHSGGGGTELLPALRRALALPKAEEGMARSVVMITDGYVNVEQEAFELIQNNLDEANMFSFGIGSSVNRHLIEGMAYVGRGEPMVITQEAEAFTQAEKFRDYVNSPVLTQVKVNYGDFEAYDVQPVSVPDVLAERPVVVFGKYRGSAKGKIKVKGFAGRQRYQKTFDVAQANRSSKNSALKYLWARETIREKMHFSSVGNKHQRELEVTDLGLKYNLMTPFTSFIAVDETPVTASNGSTVNSSQRNTTVNQPLPMPHRVNNSAVGFDLAITGVSRKSKEKLAAPRITAGPIKAALNQQQSQALKRLISEQLNGIKVDLQANKALHGKTLKVKLTLDENGTVIHVEILTPSLAVADQEYLIELLSEWTFIELELTSTTVVELPISISK